MLKERFPEFDRSRLKVLPLEKRKHDLSAAGILPLVPRSSVEESLEAVAKDILSAGKEGRSVVLMMGAHVLRAGVQRFIIDMMEKGLISCLATNGAGVIHDYELALIGATTESVARYIREGQFRLWEETGKINDIVSLAAREGMGLGEAVGRVIELEGMEHGHISVLAAAYRLGIPATVHVGIGYDIIHEHANCDGAAFGAASYRDFLRFTRVLENLEGGVVMNFGSAVMAPEVFLKALAMVRNVAHQEGRTISDFTTLVCDLKDLPDNYRCEASMELPGYYFRPWKTMLVRTVTEGGRSYYVRGDHAETIPQLWTALSTQRQDEMP